MQALSKRGDIRTKEDGSRWVCTDPEIDRWIGIPETPEDKYETMFHLLADILVNHRPTLVYEKESLLYVMTTNIGNYSGETIVETIEKAINDIYGDV